MPNYTSKNIYFSYLIQIVVIAVQLEVRKHLHNIPLERKTNYSKSYLPFPFSVFEEKILEKGLILIN